jgi:hypothetical protein
MGNDSNNYRLDSKVILTSLVLSAFFLVLIGFRLTKSEKCPKVDFKYETRDNSQDDYYIKEKINFSVIGYDIEECVWDFGDMTPVDKNSGAFVSHEYTKAGIYPVQLTVNGKCSKIRNINIREKQIIKHKWSTHPVWPAEPLVSGQVYNFIDTTSGATERRWYFDDETTPRIGRQVQKIFETPGEYKVHLFVRIGEESETITKPFIVDPSPTVISRPNTNNPPPKNNTDKNQVGRSSNVQIPKDPATEEKEVKEEIKPLKGIDDLMKKETKTPLEDPELRGFILNINKGGDADLKSYMSKDCKIYFNENIVSMDELKANIAYHKTLDKKNRSYGKTLRVNHKTNENGFITTIDITAELNQPKIPSVLDPRRKYPNN